MRAQDNAIMVNSRVHGLDILAKLGPVKNQTWRWQAVEFHLGHSVRLQ